MKRVLFVVAFASMALFISCTNKQDVVSGIAKQFLEAYFKTDYPNAATLCTKELAEQIEISFRQFDKLDTGVKEMFLKQAGGVSTDVVSVIFKGGDSAVVKYKVVLPNFPNGVENSLTMIKDQEGWKIGLLGE